MDKLIVVYSHKTVLHTMRMNNQDNLSRMDESHKWDFGQKKPDTKMGASYGIPLIWC